MLILARKTMERLNVTTGQQRKEPMDPQDNITKSQWIPRTTSRRANGSPGPQWKEPKDPQDNIMKSQRLKQENGMKSQRLHRHNNMKSQRIHQDNSMNSWAVVAQWLRCWTINLWQVAIVGSLSNAL